MKFEGKFIHYILDNGIYMILPSMFFISTSLNP